MTTGGDGDVQNHYQYDAFGQEVKKAEQVPNRICYTGQQFDVWTEQYYLRARYYSPRLGIFIQEDASHRDGLNLYAYCGNNPVRYYDPSGYGAAASGNSTCPPTAVINGDGVNEANAPENHSRVTIIDQAERTFQITDWSDYPDDYVPMPNQNQTFVMLEGQDYNSARDQANKVNAATRRSDSYYSDNNLEIHEVVPVKFGGSPTDPNNKVAIQAQAHRGYVTPWWNKIKKDVNNGL